MGEKTTIEWTESTWTPVRARNRATGKVGWHCEHASHGCKYCYAETLNKVYGTGLPFKPGHRADIEIFLDEKMLLAPLRWRKPRMIFVCSMTDLFADFVSDEWIDKIFAVMALCPQHTFQVLTKRTERMRRYLTDQTAYWQTGHASWRIAEIVESIRTDTRPVGPLPHLDPGEHWWPLLNVWIGTSVEDQERADERIPILLDTPAAIHWISAEPLLGPIDLTRLTRLPDDYDRRMPGFATVECFFTDALTGCDGIQWRDGYAEREGPHRERLDWVVVGGESGQKARPMHPHWARSLRDQCQDAGVPFLFKQWGAWEESVGTVLDRGTPPGFHYFPEGDIVMRRVGKKRAGRLLDGRTWDDRPCRRLF